MPLTIPPIPDAAPFATFDDDVDIFSNSKARDIPGKLKAITEALKVHINMLWLATATGGPGQLRRSWGAPTSTIFLIPWL